MVQVFLAEEDRGRVGAEHCLGSQFADETHDLLAQRSCVVLDLAVGMPEGVEARELEHLRRPASISSDAGLCQIARASRRIGGALVPVRADENVDLAPSAHPTREGAAARDVRIVGMCVDSERPAREPTRAARAMLNPSSSAPWTW